VSRCASAMLKVCYGSMAGFRGATFETSRRLSKPLNFRPQIALANILNYATGIGTESAKLPMASGTRGQLVGPRIIGVPHRGTPIDDAPRTLEAIYFLEGQRGDQVSDYFSSRSGIAFLSSLSRSIMAPSVTFGWREEKASSAFIARSPPAPDRWLGLE